MGPLTTGCIQLLALNRHRNYITDACIGARRVCAVCSRWARTCMCVEAQRTPQAQRCSRVQALLLPSLPLLLQMSPFAIGNPYRWLKLLAWPTFSGAESESCIISLQEPISLSIWSVNIKLASQYQIPERR